MDLRTSVQILKTAAKQWNEDGASEMGAALAYYALFSIAPLLVIAIAIAGLVYGDEAAHGAVRKELSETLGTDAAGAVQDILKNINRPQFGTWTAVAGVVTLMLGALSAFLHLRGALCRIWRLGPIVRSGWLAMLLDYVLAIVMVLSCGGLLLVSLTASAALVFLTNEFEGEMPGGQLPWKTLEFVVSFAFLTLLFAVLFRVLSARRIPWRLTWYGAAITSLLFTVGKTLLGYYLGYTGAASAYGAAGSLVVFLIWIYYSAQILFFGAELVQARRTLPK